MCIIEILRAHAGARKIASACQVKLSGFRTAYAITWDDWHESLRSDLLRRGSCPTPSIELVSAWSRFIIAIHLRHPDAMPELREAAKSIWDASGIDYQVRYEAIRQPTDPPTFDGYLALRDPLAPIKMRVNLIIKALDNDIVGAHVNQMPFAIIDLSGSPHRLLTFDRPVKLFNLKEPNGLVSIPISPTKLFVAANDEATFDKLRRASPRKLVCDVNTYVVSCARRFVWAQDRSQERFIENRISTKLEPTPLLPNIGRYQPPPPSTPLSGFIDP
jgi:hypothetical protein